MKRRKVSVTEADIAGRDGTETGNIDDRNFTLVKEWILKYCMTEIQPSTFYLQISH